MDPPPIISGGATIVNDRGKDTEKSFMMTKIYGELMHFDQLFKTNSEELLAGL